jgi:hypothetical protein
MRIKLVMGKLALADQRQDETMALPTAHYAPNSAADRKRWPTIDDAAVRGGQLGLLLAQRLVFGLNHRTSMTILLAVKVGFRFHLLAQ